MLLLINKDLIRARESINKVTKEYHLNGKPLKRSTNTRVLNNRMTLKGDWNSKTKT